MSIQEDKSQKKVKLDLFMNRILAITPQYNDIFGNGVPGMAGRSAATSGAANAGADTTTSLQRKAIELARLYVAPDISDAQLNACAQEVEGLLMMAVTLGVMSETDCNHLQDVLRVLLREH